MGLLVEVDTAADVQEAVFFAVANLLDLEVDLLFFDTTNTYFERDTKDPDPADEQDGSTGFRRYAHSTHIAAICHDRRRACRDLGGDPGPLLVLAR